jgi:hypothetical protein
MAFRRPLYYDNGHLREMSDSQINNLSTRCSHLFINNPSVYLRRLSSGGNLGNITDTRIRAGGYSTRVDRFPRESETAEPTRVNVNYSRVDQVVQNTNVNDLNNIEFPLYYDANGDLRAMSVQDMYDTFGYNAVLDHLDGAGQLYIINTGTSFSGYSAVSTSSIFSDTSANLSAYTGSGIPETLDQPYTVNNYYLLKKNAGSVGIVTPVKTDGTDVIQMSEGETNNTLEEIVRHLVAEVTGYRLRFSWNGSGTDTGTVIDSRLNGSGNYQTRFVNANDYRAQEFPNGSRVTVSTYRLRVRRV